MPDPSHLAPGRGPALTRRAALAGALQALALLAACTNLPAPVLIEPASQAGTGAAPAPPSALPAAPDAACLARLPAAVAPTPLPYPGSTMQEPETGLHVTGPAHVLDLAAYRLAVTGKVARPLSLTFDELRCLPTMQAEVTLECPDFFIDQETLGGTSLAGLLALAGPLPGAGTVRFRAVDGYERDFTLAEVQAPEVFLAYRLGDRLLPASHGFPLRAVIPGRQGSTWMKWLLGMEVS